ncbi:HFX_2341 family transcriptional regulator domain-containing protein [Methanofollis fontis]|uniref:HFX_2341 family transcriptional regulator domain-containing protein n=1 Tax=Methanofollis fontis TaxID=2052832 RepID=UPI001F2BD93E|nr:DUF6293 family protein [Methanofollis fontis]
MNIRSGLSETVHIIPLGHEIDRAVKPFTRTRADRAYVLTVPKAADLDPEMNNKQQFFLDRVIEELQGFGIPVTFVPVNMFSIPDVMRVIARIIRTEQEVGNRVLVNMSSCGRKTSVAVTLAAMVHDAAVYYVSADRYASSGGPEDERRHGLSVVEEVRTEMFQNFRIMMPKHENLLLLAELYRRRHEGDGRMESDMIIEFFHESGVYGFSSDDLPPKKNRGYEPGGRKRALLNRINRGFLEELERQGYVERIREGRRFSIRITEAGEYIACVSGLLED